MVHEISLAEQKYTFNVTLNNMPSDCLDFDFNFTQLQKCGSSNLILRVRVIFVPIFVDKSW